MNTCIANIPLIVPSSVPLNIISVNQTKTPFCTQNFPYYIWFSIQNRSLRLGFSQPNVLIAYKKTISAVKLSTHRARISPSKQVLGSTRYSRARFYSSLVSLRGLKYVRKGKSLTNSIRSTVHTLHTGKLWLPHYLNSVNYHRLLGSRPKRKNLEGTRNTILDPSNALVTRPSPKKTNTKSAALNRLTGNSRVRRFIYYVRLRSASKAPESFARPPQTGTNASMSTRRLRLVKDERYFKPYTFVGLKKIPKYLVNDPFVTMFKQARRLLRASRVLKSGTKPKMSRLVSAFSYYSKDTRGSKLFGVDPLVLPNFSNVKYRYRAKRLLNKFLKTRKFRLPKSRLVRIPCYSLFSLTRLPYRPLLTTLNLPSLSTYSTSLKTFSPASSASVLLSSKPLNVDKSSLMVPRSSFVSVTNANASVVLYDHAVPYQNKKFALRRVWALYSSRFLAAPRTYSIFTAALLSWVARKRLYARLTLASQARFKVALRKLLPRFGKQVYVKTWAKRAFSRKPFRALILKITALVKSFPSAELRIFDSSIPSYNVSDTYPSNKLLGLYPVSNYLLRSKYRRNFSQTRYLCGTAFSSLQLQNVDSTQLRGHLSSQVNAIAGSPASLKLPLSMHLVNSNPPSLPFKRSSVVRIHSRPLDPSSQTSASGLFKLPLFKLTDLRLSSTSAVTDDLNPTRLKIYPSYSPDFVRTPFFFMRLFSLRNPYLTDLVSIKKRLRSRFSYLVFPEANDIKVAIFRRLNRQKFLAQSRMFALNTRVHARPPYRFHNNVIRKGASLWPFRLRRSKAILSGDTEYSKTRGALGRFLRVPKKSLRIRRIRFKPGYGRIWRKARRSIREILNIHSRYQYRLTPKLQNHYFRHRATEQSYSTFNLEFALMTTRLAPDVWSTAELLNNNYVFLNGTTSVNPSTRLFLNDLIQLVVNIKFYIALRWLRNWYGIKQNRINKIYYRKFRPSTFNKDIKVVRNLPTWFYDLQYTHSDVPKYFEMDYFTLSVFVVHDRLKFEKWMPTKANLYNSNEVNMYNWKYIT